MAAAPTLTVPESDEEYTLGTDGDGDSLTISGDDDDVAPHLGDVSPGPLEVPPSPPTPAAAAAPPPAAVPAPVELVLPPAAVAVPTTLEVDIPEEVRKEKGRKPRMAESDRGKFVAVGWFVAAVTVGYAVVTAALLVNPGLTEQWFGNIPWIGSLRDDRMLTRKVSLSEVTGAYQRIKDGKDVFVISGKAMNTAPVPLQGVQISGRLFNQDGQGVDEKVIHCGNVISTRVLKDLTPRELSVLQKLNPPSRFTIDPGASSTFVIVFMDPPKGAASFSAQVVAARRQT